MNMLRRPFNNGLITLLTALAGLLAATLALLFARRRRSAPAHDIQPTPAAVKVSTAPELPAIAVLPAERQSQRGGLSVLGAGALVIALAAVFLLPPPTGGAVAAVLVGALSFCALLVLLLRLPVFAASTPVVRALAAGALLLMVISTLLQRAAGLYRTSLDFYSLLLGFFALLAGGVLLSAAAYRAGTPPPVPRAAAVQRGTIRRGLVAVGALLLALLAEINGKVLGIAPLEGVATHVQFALLCAGCALVATGLVGEVADRSPASHWRRNPDVWLMLAVAALALLLRTIALNQTLRILVDERAFMVEINNVVFNPDVRLTAPMGGVFPFTRLFSYWQTALVSIFGRDWFGFRAAGALVGTLTVAALYGLARTLFDRRTAVIAGVLFAVLPPALHFGRLGLNNIADPLFGTLAFWFLARGFITGRWLDYSLAGVMLGLTQYFHEAGRLLFPPLVALWALAAWRLWRVRVGWRELALVGGAALLVALPVYYTFTALSFNFTNRVGAWGFNGDYVTQLLTMPPVAEAHLIEKTIPALLVYIGQPDPSFYYARGYEPLLLVYVAPLFLLGLCYALWRWREPAFLLPLLWLLAVSGGNSLLVGSATSIRYIAAFPPIALLCAAGMRYTLPLLLPRAERLRTLVTVLLVALLAVGQVVYYFGQHIPFVETQARYFPVGELDGVDAMQRAAAYPRYTQSHLIGTPPFDAGFAQGVLDFFTAGDSTRRVDQVDPRAADLNAYVAALAPNMDHLFFLEPDDWQTPEVLRARFPQLQGPLNSSFPMPPGTAYVLYYAPVIR